MTREVPLTRGLVALVDDEDYDKVIAAGSWSALPGRKTWYGKHALRRGDRNTTQTLHSFLTGWSRVDHINGDGLDNRRVNLRPASTAQNARNRGRQANNTSGFKGVYIRGSRWRAMIQVDGRLIHLGSHSDPESAARAYDSAASQHFGEFAHLNFPREKTS
jgi:hypothetical protein